MGIDGFQNRMLEEVIDCRVKDLKMAMPGPERDAAIRDCASSQDSNACALDQTARS